MDIALFSPSSLFDDQDDSSSGSLSLFLILFLYCYFEPRLSILVVDEENPEVHETYVERMHQFPGMVSL